MFRRFGVWNFISALMIYQDCIDQGRQRRMREPGIVVSRGFIRSIVRYGNIY